MREFKHSFGGIGKNFAAFAQTAGIVYPSESSFRTAIAPGYFSRKPPLSTIPTTRNFWLNTKTTSPAQSLTASLIISKMKTLCVMLAANDPFGNSVAIGGNEITIAAFAEDGRRISRKIKVEETPPCLSVAIDDLLKWLADEQRDST